MPGPSMRWAWALGAAATLFGATITSDDAQASVAVAATWEGLLSNSTAAVIVQPIDASSVWENGRIYTYTRLHVTRTVAGTVGAGSETSLQTMGGVVGDIGQLVEGEAVLAPGEPALLFVHPLASGAFAVTGRGQGQFPVSVGDAHTAPRVLRNHATGVLLAPHVHVSSPATRLAADVLSDRPLDDAAREIAADWGKYHAQ